jgi:hypothetical protein
MRSICLILMFFVVACSPAQSPEYLAVQGNKELAVGEFTAQDKIALYLLHWQEFLTLRDIVQNWTVTQKSDQVVNSTVKIPVAPQIHYATQPDWVLGSNQASLKIQLFCTLVSEPCKRVYRDVFQFMPYVQGGMQIQFYESWQTYHKFALDAAMAMACVPADRQADLRQFLLSENNITPARLDDSALLLQFDPVAFKQCRARPELRQRFMLQRKAVQTAGLDKTPILLINTQYWSQADEERLYAYLQPLLQSHAAVKTMPQLDVQQIYVLHPAELSFADVIYQGQKRRWPLFQCQDGWCLDHIEKQVLVFFKEGQFYTTLPRIPTVGDSAVVSVQPETVEQVAAQVSAENNASLTAPADDDHEVRVRQILNATPASPLSRVWVDEQLNRQSELEKNFIAADLEVEGNHLLKLKSDELDTFYTQLGMQAGDVVMRVNDEWVHDHYNTLWEALRSGSRVEISLMRRGLPVHLVYAVQEP